MSFVVSTIYLDNDNERCFVHSSLLTAWSLLVITREPHHHNDQFLLRIACNQIHGEQGPDPATVLSFTLNICLDHVTPPACDDLMMTSGLWSYQTPLIWDWAAPTHWAWSACIIQMISDPVFVTISHSVLRLLWEEPLNGSDCLSLYFLNYCIFTDFTVPLPAIVTDTHCDGCHLHWAQKAGSCLSLNCHSSKCAVTLYIRWWPLSPALAWLRARPNSAYSSTGGGVWRLLIKFDRKLL